MDLLSFAFLLLLLGSLAAYYTVGHLAPTRQWWVLLAASLAFYFFAGGIPALGLLFATSLDVYAGARLFAKIEGESKEARKATRDRKERKEIKERFAKRKRYALIAVLLIPLGILAVFKYLNVVLFNFGFAPDPRSLGLMLPLGISFYTFQSLGYLIDIYNGKYAPEDNYARFLLFVSWFPQMIQGPISRYDQIASQLFASRKPDAYAMRKGMLRLGYGLFKKLAIANVLSWNVNGIFDRVTPAIPGSLVVYGVLAYSIQMYADFSGGIDLVEGISELFGVQMAQNFRQPYFATSLADFWRRWHMSLGSWMRDYVFYPVALTRPMQALGKWSRANLSTHVGRTLPAGIANIIVFLLVGLWHGADWHYIAWGLYNGVVVALSDLFAPSFTKLGERLHVDVESRGFYVFSVVRTFIVVNVGRYFDCTATVHDSLICVANTFTNFAPVPFREALSLYGIGGAEVYGISRVVVLCLVIIFCISVFSERGVDVRDKILHAKAPLRWALYLVCALIVIYQFDYTANGGGGFLYANF